MGVPESGAREIIAMKPSTSRATPRSGYSRRFDVSNTEIRLQRDPNGPGGFQLLIDRQPAHTWFRQRYVELMTRLGYPSAPHVPSSDDIPLNDKHRLKDKKNIGRTAGFFLHKVKKLA